MYPYNPTVDGACVTRLAIQRKASPILTPTPESFPRLPFIVIAARIAVPNAYAEEPSRRDVQILTVCQQVSEQPSMTTPQTKADCGTALQIEACANRPHGSKGRFGERAWLGCSSLKTAWCPSRLLSITLRTCSTNLAPRLLSESHKSHRRHHGSFKPRYGICTPQIVMLTASQTSVTEGRRESKTMWIRLGRDHIQMSKSHASSNLLSTPKYGHYGSLN